MRRPSLFCGWIIPRAPRLVKRFLHIFYRARAYWGLQQNAGKEACAVKGNDQNQNRNQNQDQNQDRNQNNSRNQNNQNNK